jgi:periplasmic protein TonB
MFTNLIESDSHRQEFKRRSSFFLATVAAYALILSGAGVASIYAYDAHLEAQSDDLVLLNWVPPVTPDRARPEPPRRAAATTNNSRVSSQPVRPILYENVSNPIKPPDQISAAPNPIPPAPRNAIVGNYIADPVGPPRGASDCVTCSGTGGNDGGPIIKVDTGTPPPPVVVKPQSTLKVSQGVLTAKAISLPQPAYPSLAKQIHIQGPVTVQILVDEEGRVVSAQTMTGHPMLLAAAKEAALRARFTATKLSGQPVKVQGLITYNFVLQ